MSEYVFEELHPGIDGEQECEAYVDEDCTDLAVWVVMKDDTPRNFGYRFCVSCGNQIMEWLAGRGDKVDKVDIV